MAKKAPSQVERPQQSLAFDYLHSVVATELELTYRTFGVKPAMGKEQRPNVSENSQKGRKKVVAA